MPIIIIIITCMYFFFFLWYRNDRGEMAMEGLKILLEFALARGNLASILKALQDLLGKEYTNVLWQGISLHLPYLSQVR